jgi:hypothetical protein
MTEPITTRIPTDEQFAAAREIIRQEGGYVVGIGELLIEMGVEVTTEMAWVLNLTSELWDDEHIVPSSSEVEVDFVWWEKPR